MGSMRPEEQEALRRRAVRAVEEGGLTQSEVARVYGVTRASVNSWVSKYRRAGEDALRARPRGRPTVRQLHGRKLAEVATILVYRLPDDFGFPEPLWNRSAIHRLLGERFDLAVSRWSVGRYLADLGFEAPEPLEGWSRRQPREAERWLRGPYQAIRRDARRRKQTLYWIEETWPAWWLDRRGEGMARRTPPGVRASTLTALDGRGQMSFMGQPGRAGVGRTIEFFRRLERQNRAPAVAIVADRAVYRSARLQKWLSTRSKEGGFRLIRALATD